MSIRIKKTQGQYYFKYYVKILILILRYDTIIVTGKDKKEGGAMIKDNINTFLKWLSDEDNWLRINRLINILLALQLFGFFKWGISGYILIMLYALCIVMNGAYFIKRKRYIEIVLFSALFVGIGYFIYCASLVR